MRGFHHLALRVRDVERSLGFYAGVLGLPELDRRPGPEGGLEAAWLVLEPGILMLERTLRGEGAEAGSGHVLAIGVQDLGAWGQRLFEAGIAVVDRTDATLFVQDPDGHRVGLSVYPGHFSVATKTRSQSSGGGSSRKPRHRSARTRLGGSSGSRSRRRKAPPKSRSQ